MEKGRPDERALRNGVSDEDEETPDAFRVSSPRSVYDQPEEANVPQLNIVPGLIATILWVALLVWLATLPGGPLYLPTKATPAPTVPAEVGG